MKHTDLTNEALIKKILKVDQAQTIQPVEVGETKRENELVFFIKPELLDVKDAGKIANSTELIQNKLAVFEVLIRGIIIVPGPVLEEHGIMNRHYGFINQLSRKASEMVDTATRKRLFDLLDQDDTGEHRILGGHEFLKAFDTDMNTLSKVWFAQEANKLRSGFYFIEDTVADQPVILINGFHPSQLEHFTRKDHRIVLMLLHTDTDWKGLKFDLVGDTFPERAKTDSIRGQLFHHPDHFGLAEVGINTNGVHLSAGPFEAAFEVVNFFGPLLNLNPTETPPLAVKKSVAAGFEKETALSLLENPLVNEKDLFSETENMNTGEAVTFAQENL